MKTLSELHMLIHALLAHRRDALFYELAKLDALQQALARFDKDEDAYVVSVLSTDMLMVYEHIELEVQNA